MQRIARHRRVYAAVSYSMPVQVHALNISITTLKEAGTLIDHAQAGVFFGATNHDVAQVVGAGYGVPAQTGHEGHH